MVSIIPKPHPCLGDVIPHTFGQASWPQSSFWPSGLGPLSRLSHLSSGPFLQAVPSAHVHCLAPGISPILHSCALGHWPSSLGVPDTRTGWSHCTSPLNPRPEASLPVRVPHQAPICGLLIFPIAKIQSFHTQLKHNINTSKWLHKLKSPHSGSVCHTGVVHLGSPSSQLSWVAWMPAYLSPAALLSWELLSLHHAGQTACLGLGTGLMFSKAPPPSCQVASQLHLGGSTWTNGQPTLLCYSYRVVSSLKVTGFFFFFMSYRWSSFTCDLKNKPTNKQQEICIWCAHFS